MKPRKPLSVNSPSTSSSKHAKHDLPYVMLLTVTFHHFGVLHRFTLIASKFIDTTSNQAHMSSLQPSSAPDFSSSPICLFFQNPLVLLRLVLLLPLHPRIHLIVIPLILVSLVALVTTVICSLDQIFTRGDLIPIQPALDQHSAHFKRLATQNDQSPTQLTTCPSDSMFVFSAPDSSSILKPSVVPPSPPPPGSSSSLSRFIPFNFGLSSDPPNPRNPPNL